MTTPAPSTYSGNPGASDNDAVRWLLGDTDSTNFLVTDAEISFALVAYPADPYLAAALCAEALAAKFSGEIGYSADAVSIDTSILADQYRALALQLRLSKKFGHQLAAPYVGGISVSDKELTAGDGDLVKGAFSIGFMDDKQAAQSTNAAGADLRGER